MFWTEEDIYPAVKAAEELFGKQAQYVVNDDKQFVYIGLETPKYGTIWSGDYPGTFTEVSLLADTLSARISQKVKIIDLGTSLVMN
jgi:hypothetical protein